MAPRRTRGDAVDRTAQGIDRMLRNVQTGRFERSLSALTAGALHDRDSGRDRRRAVHGRRLAASRRRQPQDSSLSAPVP
jgi:hypothetical protein